MAYKRYIKIGGKLYGPYEYHSYRDKDGSVKSHYLKKVEHENVALKKKIKFLEGAVSGLMIVLLVLIILYVSKPQITGRLALDLEKDTFNLNEILQGKLKIDFAEGEFYPADAIIRVNFNGQTKEMTLEQFVSMTGCSLDKKEEDFYVIRGPQIEGSGEGYGFIGHKDIPVDVMFQLEISPVFLNITENVTEENMTNVTNVTNVTNITGENITNITGENITNITGENITNITEINITEENITEENVTGENVTGGNVTEGDVTEEPEENVTEPEQPPEEQPPEEVTPEQPAEEAPPEQPLEIPPEEAPPEAEAPAEAEAPSEEGEAGGEAPSCEPAESALTGAAIGESRIIDGNCSANRAFTYPLENETAILVCGSVKTENKTLEDSEVDVEVEHGNVKVTTEYQERIEGFGSEFLTGEEQEIDLDIGTFDFTADREGTYILSLEMIYENITIMQTAVQVNFLNLTNVTNITNVTGAPVLIKDIPDITIWKNTNASLDLSDYFEDSNNDTLEFMVGAIDDITIEFDGSKALIVPYADFVGERRTKFYASDGENETESNLVKIEVIEPGNYSIAVVDKDGAVWDSMLLNTTRVKIDVDKVVVDGNEGFRIIANVFAEGNVIEEPEENTTETNITEENTSVENETALGENFSITGLAVKNKLGNKGKAKGTMSGETEEILYNSTINFISWKDSVTIQIDKPAQKHISEGIVTEIFAIEPSEEIKIDNATIILEKVNDTNVSAIITCSDWDIDDFDCDSGWYATNISFEQDNETVAFNVSEFSAYAGVSTTNETIQVTLISNTEQCLVNCESIINIYVPENLVKEKTEKIKLDKAKASKLVEEKEMKLEEDGKREGKEKKLKVDKEQWLDTNLIDLWFLETEDSSLENFVLEKAVNVTKEKVVYDYEPCGESSITQEAKKICVKGSHIEKYNVTEWKPLIEVGLNVGNNLVRVSGIKKARLGENNIDWKIAFNVSEIVPGAMYIEPELAWWNSSWGMRVPVLVWGPNGGSPENYSIPMNISYDSDMQNDFDDLRFVDDDNTTELDYWIQEKSNGAWALVWVEIKDAISDSENQTIYIYYGNPSANSKSNISTTFLFGDDFNDGSIAPEWMNNTGPIYEANGVIFMNTSSYTDVAKLYINTTGGITYDFAVMAKVRPDYLDSSDYRLGIAMKHEWNGSGDGYNLLIKYDNTSSVVFLDDWSAWGNEAYPGFSYSEDNWYWFEMATTMGLMWDNEYGRSWQVSSAKPDWQVTQQWNTRSGATAGINLGYLSYGSFDDFILRKYSGNEPFAYAINTTQETANLVVNASSPACITGEAYYSTIQAAINAASNGAVITVCPGTYTENVKVNKTVTIDGYSATISDTIVKATTTSNDAFEVTKNSSIIKDLTVKDSRYGIYLNGNVYYTTISNINFSANTRAIYIYNSKNNTITDVTITATANSAYGVYIDSNSHFNSLANANILLTGSNSYAIALTSSSNNTLNGNNATLYSTTSYGVYIYSGSNDNIVNNSIVKTNGSNSHGIYLYSGCLRNVINLNTVNVTGSGANGIYGYYGTFDRNNITNNIVQKAEKGIYLSTFHNNLIKNNTVLNANTGSSSYGVYLSQCENSTLQDNQINNSRYGLYMDGTDKWDFNHSIDTSNLVNGYSIYYFNNHASNIDCSSLNQAALNNTNVTAGDIGKIAVANSQNIIVENCNISNENQEGNAIAVVYSNNITVKNSNASNNQWAAYLEASNNSNISNIRSSGYKGIQLFSYSMNNTIENSRINTTGANGYGIYLYSYSINNTIRNNDARVFNSGRVASIESYSTSNNISNNNFTSNCTSCYGVYFGQLSNNNNLSYNFINTTGSSAYGILVSNSHNLTENYDTVYTSGANTYGIYLYSSDDSKINNSFVKTTNSNAHGIYLYSGADRNLINNNTINVSGSGASGIEIYYGTNRWNNLTNNIIQKSDSGIYLGGGPITADTFMKNNTVLNATSYGIYLSQCENSTLQDNQINNSRYGLYMDGTDKWDFNHSIDTSNLVNGYPIYYFNNHASNIDCSSLNQAALSNTNVTAGDIGKIAVANSQNIIVENCNISNENQEGNAIAVVYSNNITVKNSNSSNNQYTVYLEASNNSNISNIRSSGYKGIQLFSYSMNNTIENSRINTSATNGYGIYVYYYSNGTVIKNNDIRAGSTGIYLYQYSMNNTLIQNNITITTTSAYAIDVQSHSHNGNLSGNIINTSCFGSRFNGVNNYTMDANAITLGSCGGNPYGFYIAGSNDNIINNSVITSLVSSYTRGVYVGNGALRNLVNNNTIYITQSGGYGIIIETSTNDKNNLTNNNISVLGINSRGIYFGATTTNSTVSGNTIDTNRSNTNSWAFYSDSTSNVKNTFVGNVLKGDDPSADVNVSFTHNGSINLRVIPNASRPSNPGSYENINKYINATNMSANAWLYLNISYNDSEIALVDENSLFMARHNGTWETNTSKFSSTSGLNADENYVYANITNFSVFAPLGNPKNGCVGEHYVFVCGDRVNESCTMNCDLNATGTCFTIGANNIILDGAGYSINYSSASDSYGIDNGAGYDNVTIENFIIRQTNSSNRGFSIFFNYSDNSIVEFNNMSKGKGGLLVMNSLNATIRHNYGEYFEYGEATDWDACQPFNDTAPWKYYESAIWLVDSNNATIWNNTIQGNMSEEGLTNHNGTEAGITLCRSNYSNLSNNILRATDTYGFMITTNSIYNQFYYNFVNGSDSSGATNTNDGIILAASSNNNNISHNTFIECNEWGIFLSDSDSNFIRNNTANHNTLVGIRIGGTSSYNEIYDNIANNNGDSGLTLNGNHNIARNNTLNSNMKGTSFMDSTAGYCSNNTVKDTEMDLNTYGIYVDLNNAQGCTDNLVWDSNITNSVSNDVFVGALEGSQTFNLTLLNVSFNKSNVVISNDVETGELYVKWYLDVYVQNKTNGPIEGANVSAWDNYGALTFTELTNSSGYITRQNVTEYYENSTAKYYSTNYTVNVSKSTYATKSQQVNLTTNKLLNFTLNRAPSQVTLINPPNGNHTTDRTPFFNWTATDADGDSLQYTWNVTCEKSIPGSCSPLDDRNVENLTNNNYTPADSAFLKNFWDTQEYYLWKVRAWDGEDYGEWSDVWNVSIDSLIALSTINPTAAFGNLTPGTVNDTVDDAPQPITMQNDGNCFVNASITGSQLWNATPGTSDTYQYKFDFLEQNSFNWSGSVTNWADVPIGLTLYGMLYQFNYTDTNDSAELDIRLAPLSEEPMGAKNSQINLTGTFEDVAE